MSRSSLLVAAAVALLAPAAAQASAVGQPQQLSGTAGCVHFVSPPEEGCAGGVPANALGYLVSPALSPDARHLYLVSTALLALERDGAGSFTTVGCWTSPSDEVNGCASSEAIHNPSAVAVSPDGKHLYAVSNDHYSITAFARDPSTGTLNPLSSPDGGCLSEGGSSGTCGLGRGLSQAGSIAISADGQNVYVGGSDSVAVLSRDATTGKLAQSAGADGCIARTDSAGCTPAKAVSGLLSVAISPDGHNLYVASESDMSIATFARSANGALSQLSGTKGCISETGNLGGLVGVCIDGRALNGVGGQGGLTISPDGRHVYVASGTSSAVAVLIRDSGDGSLTQDSDRDRGCISETGRDSQSGPVVCADGRTLYGASGVVVAPDGEHVYAAAGTAQGVSAFARDPHSGQLTQLPGTDGCVTQSGADYPMSLGGTGGECAVGRSLFGAGSIAVTPDATGIYATGLRSIAAFERHYPPANVAPPAVSGVPRDGELLTADPGSWRGPAITFAYRWRRCDAGGEGCEDITVQGDRSSYRATTADVGSRLRVLVTASNGSGEGAATSDPTPEVEPVGPEGAPENDVVPLLDGTFRDEGVGEASTGTWAGDLPMSFAYQWQRREGDAWIDVPGASSRTYGFVAADVDRRLRVRVTATNQRGSEVAYSEPSPVIAPLAPISVQPPRVSGPQEVNPGDELTLASEGSWRGTPPISYRLDWMRCAEGRCHVIEGASGPATQGARYRVSASDRGWESIQARVTASNRGGEEPANSNRVAIAEYVPCELRHTQPELCGKRPIIFVPGFAASEIECTNAVGAQDNLWPNALYNPGEFEYMHLAPDGVSPGGSSRCSQSAGPNGKIVEEVLGVIGVDVHLDSKAWLERIAPGHSYFLGWDWRKGPDANIGRLDALVNDARRRHGVSKVTILNHSYGGLLTRWYIDSPARARKVLRVANFASPFWGTPKAWFAMAHGTEGTAFEQLDLLLNNRIFKRFTRNLTGLYYLFPSRAWFGAPVDGQAPDSAPTLRPWLETEGTARNFSGALSEITRYGGNASIALAAANGHRDHVDGFVGASRAGVDWRTFVGTGLPAIGHVRETLGPLGTFAADGQSTFVSWVNGDGTVALQSQRQFAKSPANQLGERVPTYYMCGIAHTAQLEQKPVQDAVTPFLLRGEDPVRDEQTLRSEPCRLSSSQFTTWFGREDERSIRISEASERETSPSAASASARRSMTLAQAERDGLIDVVFRGRRTVFVTTSRKRLTVTFRRGFQRLRATPLVGDRREGRLSEYARTRAAVTVRVDGTRSAARSRGRSLRTVRPDRRPPTTRAIVRRRGRTALVRFVARDASGVLGTSVRIGRGRERRVKRTIKVPVRRLRSMRYRSVDLFGNVERPRKLRSRRARGR